MGWQNYESSDWQAQPWKSQKHQGDDLQVLILTGDVHESDSFSGIGKPIARQSHQISRTDISECRARDGVCRQFILSHAHFSQFSQSL